MRLSIGPIAPVILVVLTVVYICSLSIQIVAIHKNFRVEVALGPLIAKLQESKTTAAVSRDQKNEELKATGSENMSENDLNSTAIEPRANRDQNETSDAFLSWKNLLEKRMRKRIEESEIKLPPLIERAPRFIILGAQKAGTQALRTYLSQHPKVVTTTKTPETHFFDKYYRAKLSPQENLEVYLNRSFDVDCRKNGTDCISGESTPFYLYDTVHVPKRIKRTCPHVKFIVMLRDPVKRAFSQCSMLIDKNEINGRTFEEHLEMDLNRMIDVGLIRNTTLTPEEEDKAWSEYQNHKKWRKAMIGRGFYEYQLRKWLEHFPREQFLILNAQDLDDDRTATMRRIYKFLGLPYYKLPKGGNKIHRRKYKKEMPNKVRDFLYEFYQPYNERLAQLLGPEWRGIWKQKEESESESNAEEATNE